MTKHAKLAQLQELANLAVDHRLSALRKAAMARDETLRKIEALRTPPTLLGEDGVPGALAALNYQRWAEARQIELRHLLARQTAVWLDAKQDAMQSFGRSQALDALREKLRP